MYKGPDAHARGLQTLSRTNRLRAGRGALTTYRAARVLSHELRHIEDEPVENDKPATQAPSDAG
jgi:hypothetical protein